MLRGQICSTPKVGVVMCTYNGAAYLEQQLESILAQSRPVDEIVIADDASTDGTMELLQQFSLRATEAGIRVLLKRREANVGFVQNFSDALLIGSAQIVFLCDQDDVWHQDHVSTYLPMFDQDERLLLLHGDARLVGQEGESLGSTLFEVMRIHPMELAQERSSTPIDALLLRNLMTGATCALRRELIAMALPVGTDWVHDEWLAVVAALEGNINFIDRPTVDYRQHGRNQIGAHYRSFSQRLASVHLASAQRREYMGNRLRVFAGFLDGRKPRLAPAGLDGLAALAWRMAWARARLYRDNRVGLAWVLHDLPRLMARELNIAFAGGGLASLMAGMSGAWRGWRAKRTEPDA